MPFVIQKSTTRESCDSADVAPTRGQLYRTFHRRQAFLRGVTIGRDLAWFHYARNNVFSRLRLVISWRFRLLGSTTRIARTKLAQRARTTGNGGDTALQFATQTPRISSSGKTRQKFPSSPWGDDNEISINSPPPLRFLTPCSHRSNFINACRKSCHSWLV